MLANLRKFGTWVLADTALPFLRAMCPLAEPNLEPATGLLRHPFGNAF